MARPRTVKHHEVYLLDEWSSRASRGHLAPSSVSCYTTDIGNFMRSIDPMPLGDVTEAIVIDFLGKRPERVRKRSLSAQTEFFTDIGKRIPLRLESPPLHKLKHNRARSRDAAQLDFLALLKADGIEGRQAAELTWSDFVEPITRSSRYDENVLRGHDGKIAIRTWRVLEEEFKARVSQSNLRTLMRSKIAS